MLITEHDRMMTATDSRMMTRVCAHWEAGFERILMYLSIFLLQKYTKPLVFPNIIPIFAVL